MLRATPRDPPGAYPRTPTLAGRQEAIPRCRGQRAMPPPDWLQICTPWVLQDWGGAGVKGTPGSRTRSAAAGEHRTGEDVGEAEPLTPEEPQTLRAGEQVRRPKAARPAPLPRGERLPSPAGRGAGGSGYGSQKGTGGHQSAAVGSFGHRAGSGLGGRVAGLCGALFGPGIGPLSLYLILKG